MFVIILMVYGLLQHVEASNEIVVPKLTKLSHEKIVVLITGKINVQIVLKKYDYTFTYGPVSFDQCFFNGNINNNPRYYAAMDVCNGLNGVFFYQDKTFYLTPRKNNSLGEHTLEEIRKNLTKNFLKKSLYCSFDFKLSNYSNSTYQNPKNLRIRRDEEQYADKYYVELYFVNDYSVFKYYKSNISEVIRRTNLIASILDAKYAVLRTRIIVVGIDVWNDGDKMEVVDESLQTIQNFMNYRTKYIQVKNDNAQFITKKPFDKGFTAGKAPVGTMCSGKNSVGINHDTYDNPVYISNVVAHELGHNLGMVHDEHTQCLCYDNEKSNCIMGSYLDGDVKSFSECSVRYFNAFISSGKGACLYDYPVGWVKPPICGNGIIEKGEECDCGSRKNCAFFGNCCHPVTCTLHKNATCASGGCCHKCQFQPRGTTCRKKSKECDLPEYCNGESNTCPKDVYIQDSYSCGAGKGFCKKGVCLTHKRQCVDLFGANVSSGDAYCYKQLNIKGSDAGHCGVSSNKFLRCNYTDALCGKLQCNKINQDNLLHYRLVWSELNDTRKCESVKNNSTNILNNLVKDGTRCGSASICINYTCISLLKYQIIFKIPKCPLNCSHHGICNSNGNCHCYSGWKTPYCDRPGDGGSIDSGPPPIVSDTIISSNILDILVYLYLASGLVFFIIGLFWHTRNVRKRLKYAEKEKDFEKEKLLS
ncbi:zinc metalloproteinase-disintegrin-like atrolysin-A isoform X1 [Hydra vulgaris]|uniref:Zinc metalloproteinase-disintegrin-like atrolysin-A isoform X1 n=1 Tax=Hydra vulgaris TaxID=6087 RepID=A0ABM4CIK5_HYDVU